MNNNWCLIVLQNVIIKSNSFQYICRGAFFRGAYAFFCLQVDGPITGGVEAGGGGAYKREFTVCDWPGFEI